MVEFVSKRIKAKRQKPIFQVGDRVRLSKKQKMFDESYLPQWTEEVLLVKSSDSWGGHYLRDYRMERDPY